MLVCGSPKGLEGLPPIPSWVAPVTTDRFNHPVPRRLAGSLVGGRSTSAARCSAVVEPRRTQRLGFWVIFVNPLLESKATAGQGDDVTKSAPFCSISAPPFTAVMLGILS